MANFTFEIQESIAVLSEDSKGGTKELNVVAFNGREGMLDIRTWDEDHERMGKGIRLTEEEAEILCEELMERLGKKE